MRNPRRKLRVGIVASLLGVSVFLAEAQAAPLPSLVQQAQLYEKQGRWFEACSAYDELLGRDRNHPEFRESYRRCLRHFRQERRHQEKGLRSVLRKLSASEALDLYDHLLTIVVTHYVDRDRVDVNVLFQEGIAEIQTALDKESFVKNYLPRASEEQIDAFREKLAEWRDKRVGSLAEAKRYLGDLLRRDETKALRVRPGVWALECACGACNSLDEYSLYLAPARVSPARAALRRKVVGIGVELAVSDQRLEIARVYRKSPAAAAGLLEGDRLTRIDGRRVNPAAPDLASERLFGPPGTTVEVEILPRGQTTAQTVKVERQAVTPGSVDFEVLSGGGSYLGYIRIYHFQKSTLREVKDALAQFDGMPLRGVILDLRGNPGGLFDSALAVSELFLPEGVIAFTHGQLSWSNREYRSRNMNPFPLPLVVLVDGQTASAAEVLAGALKDSQRAVLVGQPTYGKGSIQIVIPLDEAPGGLRLTVAKYTSPARVPYNGRGVLPDFPVSDGDGDLALKAAEQILRGMPAMR